MGNVIPKDVVLAAEASQIKWLVPASVSIAQWALESDWGKHEPVGSNNPFGIKAVSGQPSVATPTHEVVDGKSVATTAEFAKYANLDEAFDAHGKLLATNHHYKAAMAARMDADAFANALTGVYATDPAYGAKLIEIMKADNLYAYNKLPDVVEPTKPAEPVAAVLPEPAPVKPVVTLPAEPQHEPAPVTVKEAIPTTTVPAQASVLSSIDKLVSDLLLLKTQLQNVNAALKSMLGE